MTEQEYELMQEKALKQLKSGKSMLGKDGAFTPLLKQFLETALQAEMEEHLSEVERSKKNKRNGKGKKTVISSLGEVEIETPQDRHSTFEPEIVKKRERILVESLSSKILSLYGKGMSLRDISDYVEDMYDVPVSATILSNITDRIIPDITEWQNRSLESIYPIVFMDAMHFKVREEGRVITKAMYTVLAITREGKKELLGLYISDSEGAAFWLSVLTELKNRGLEDILIACIDNLKGFSEAIETVYPKCEVQSCVIHQIRNTIKYVSSSNRKDFMTDLKLIYKANTVDLAKLELDNLEKKWGAKYPLLIKSWRNNWGKLTPYFSYSPEIRRFIYTTNIVEGFHRQIRKVTKTKGSFTSNMALMKLVYLATMQIIKKWIQSSYPIGELLCNS